MNKKHFGRRLALRQEPARFDRRRFLGLAAVGLIGACSGRRDAFGKPQMFRRSMNPRRVLVIGAGVSGLAAARTLADAGHDVLMIESRNRIGGRIDTSSQWSDAPVDLGASWIHGINGNPIAQIAQQIGAQTVVTSESGEIYDSDGGELTGAEYLRVTQLQNQMNQIIGVGQNADEDLPLRETIETGIDFGSLSAQDQRFVNFYITELEQGLSGSADLLSTYWLDDPGGFSGDEVTFPAGYRVITDHLAAGLSIEFGQTVSEIAVDSTGVSATTQHGVFSGDLAVVTLPLGVLKAGTVQFSPGLPASMQQAIDALQMGVLNKAYLRFPTRFWPDVAWLSQTAQNHGEWVNWLNVEPTSDQPILMGFNAADFGTTIESWTDQEIVAHGMERLRSIFGAGIPDPTDFQITRWGSDPHSHGSYSFLPVGAHPSMRDALAGNLENRVFFAGEATNRQYYPTVHGAYLSGLDAADKVETAAAGLEIFADGFESGDTAQWTVTVP